jgi:hypothetical protein
MKKIEIYDPAMCCSTGVCGTDVDTKLVQFANDLSWLKDQGVGVQRFNLGQEPAAFAQNAEVRTLLTKDGNRCLPIVLVDGSVATKGIYPTRDQLAHLAEVEEESTGCCGGDDEPCVETKESDCCSDKSTGSSCC